MKRKQEKDKEKTNRAVVSRRDFLTKIWWALGFVALLEFVGICISFLLPGKSNVKRGAFGGLIVAGPVDTFDPGSVTAFRNGKFYLARLVDGGFLAISLRCTHLGCTVPWVSQDNMFKCPCHASSFDITGEVVSSPATRALDIYPLTIENSIVTVDTGTKIKRQKFEISQVVRP